MNGTTVFVIVGLFLAFLVVRWRIRTGKASRKAAHKRGVAAGVTYGWDKHNIRRVYSPTQLPVGIKVDD